MKQFLLIISIAAFTACNSGKSENKLSDVPLTDSLKNEALKDTAKFTTVQWVDSISHDIGKVKLGQTVEVPFTVKNTGDYPLIISAVNPGCGCTVANKPEKPVMPGEEEKIVAKFNSEGQSPGSHTKTLTVVANTKPNTQQTLSFTVNVVN